MLTLHNILMVDLGLKKIIIMRVSRLKIKSFKKEILDFLQNLSFNNMTKDVFYM